MTVQEYNEKFYPQYNKACSFVNCLDHALQKSDDNARMQLAVIGWDEETRSFLLEAIRRMQVAASDSYKWSMQKWWKDDET